MNRDRIIFHVDVNSAFLSWSAVKRLKEDPSCLDLRTVPSVVGGDQATRHGIVTAKSIPAKKYGIQTAEPVASAMRKCPGLIVIPSDFSTYRKYSAQLMAILHRYTPLVEKASIDEAYMDVSALCLPQSAGQGEPCVPPEDPVQLAGKIRKEVRDTLEFTVNVGISSNKLLAKMASDFAKPDKTHTLFPEEVEAKMWPLPIRDLYGCGGQTARRLQEIGVSTIGEAAALPLAYLQSLLGEKAGSYIHRSANGISTSPVTVVREEPKSVSNEVTTAFDITLENYEEELIPLIQKLSGKVAGRLQKSGFYAKTVQFSVKTSDFRRRSMQTSLDDMTNSADVIFSVSKRLAQKLLLGDGRGLLYQVPGIRLVGVGTSDLGHGEYRQLSLMDLLAQSPPAEDPAPAAPARHPATSPAEAVPGAKTAEPNSAATEPVSAEAAPNAAATRPTAEATEPVSAEAAPSATAAAPDQTGADRKLAALDEMTRKIRKRYGEGAISQGIRHPSDPV